MYVSLVAGRVCCGDAMVVLVCSVMGVSLTGGALAVLAGLSGWFWAPGTWSLFAMAGGKGTSPDTPNPSCNGCWCNGRVQREGG